MMLRFIVALFLAQTMTVPVVAQSMRDRVQETIDGMAPIENQFNQSNMESTVVPYVTATPQETTLNPSEFDEKEVELQYQDDATGRAWTTMKDSATGRPAIDLGSDPLALADDAVEQSSSVVGGLFSSGGGVCSQDFQGGQFQGTQFCRKLLSRTYRNCQQTRNVSVDREDYWKCNTETREYKKTCNRSVSWYCSGSTGGNCRKNGIGIWPHSVSWNSGGWDATVYLPNRSGSCSIKTDTFYVNRKDYVSGGYLELNRVTFWGVLQVRVNGSNAYTYGGPNSNLYVGDRDCGKNCSVKAIYAGGQWIEDCSAPHRSVSPRINLYPYLSVGGAGPSWESGLNIGLSGAKTSNYVRIDIVRGNSTEGTTTPVIYATGNCCSAFSAGVNGSC